MELGTPNEPSGLTILAGILSDIQLLVTRHNNGYPQNTNEGGKS
ncbi:hypothetical protein FHW88_000510 [Mucilaginibacter sp. SG538B]|nr:hypothetical protein [Mucilaginibacter sp. SG538B]